MESELKSILDTGFYRFHFSSSVDCVSGIIQLVYTPCIYQNVVSEAQVSGQSGNDELVVWTGDQISDFVRKLGFLDTEGDTRNRIKHFLHLDQVSQCAVIM